MARALTAVLLAAALAGPAIARSGPVKAEAKKAVPFDPKWLVPYLTRGAAGRARQALLAGKPERAVKLLRRYLGRKRPKNRAQARYLLAHALLESESYAQAERIFSSLIRSYPLLQDHHRFYAARCLYKLKRFEEAAALAGKVAEGSVLRQDAGLLQADALRALGRHEQVAQLWKAFLKAHPYGKQAGKAHFRVAEALEQLASKGGPKTKAAELLAEALEHYKQVLVKAPLWRQEPEAAKRLETLARRVPDGAKKAELSSWQRLSRARAYWRKMRHKEAEGVLAELLKDKDLSPALRCRASFQRARAIFRQRQRGRSVPFYEKAIRACRLAKNTNLVVKGLYNAGRGLMSKRDFEAAIKRFARIEKEFPEHSYADDARLWTAEAYSALKKRAKEAKLLATLPATYPDGDMAREALWRLSRAAILKRKYTKALTYLNRILDELGRAEIYYALGQALYWKARILDKTGEPAKARTYYERCIREYPLSYYALMAFNRLRERHGALFRKLYRELIAKAGQHRGTWRFGPRPQFGEPGFVRGVELARLGFGEDAAQELSAVGLGIRRGSDPEDLWLTAVLFDRAGLWHRSHYVPRALERSYQSSYPLGEAYRRWAVAYPRAFSPLVHENARRAGLPEHLVLAIMREESGFYPSIESWANAVGLMQLLLRTAKKAGNEHRIEVDRKRLKDPAVNIKVGTTYLSFLYRSFGRAAPLAISGYNAGEGATLKWLRRMGGAPMDEFLDRIPYDQTRRYTKRVLASLFAYSVLYGHGPRRIPRIGQRLPKARLVRFGKARGRKKKTKKKKKKRAASKRAVGRSVSAVSR